MHLVAPQVEETVLQPDLLGVFLLARNGHGQFLGAALYRDAAGIDLDLTGRQVRVDRAGRPRLDLAVDGDHRFHAQPVQHLQRGAILVRDDLGDAVMVAQVDEQHAAMVALAMDPARQADGLADIGGSQGAAGMGAIGMHGKNSLLVWSG